MRSKDMQDKFKCEMCEYETCKNATLNKHMNIKHRQSHCVSLKERRLMHSKMIRLVMAFWSFGGEKGLGLPPTFRAWSVCVISTACNYKSPVYKAIELWAVSSDKIFVLDLCCKNIHTMTHKHKDLFDWIYEKPLEPEASLALKHKT